MRFYKESRMRKYVKEYGFLLLAENLSNKYRKKLLDTATKTGIYAAKNASNSS